jgi:hypothetical protein
MTMVGIEASGAGIRLRIPVFKGKLHGLGKGEREKGGGSRN